MPIQEGSSNVLKKDILSITMPMTNRMKIEDKSEQRSALMSGQSKG